MTNSAYSVREEATLDRSKYSEMTLGEDENDTNIDGMHHEHVKSFVSASESLVKGGSDPVRMALLTCNLVGLTFAMGIEMTYFTPYLLSLGLSKSQTSLVWLAGPLSGLVVQPLVGAFSDRSESRWGRRRPIILAGAVLACCSLLVLGFTKELVGTLVKNEETAKIPTIALAVLALYMVDFATNAMMSCSRSLVVDTLPADKQQSATAWGGRMSSIGGFTGYAVGTIDLVKVLGTTMGDTQFKQLMILASVGILTTAVVTCWAVTERTFVPGPVTAKTGRFAVLKQLWSTLRHLPPRIQAICWAVFWSLIGWFPFLFYNSTWIGELYYRYEAPEEAQTGSKDALGNMGRIGSMALTIYSVVTFVCAWVLPLLVRTPDSEGRVTKAWRPDLLTAWFAGHLIFAGAMLFAPLVASFRLATALVALCGVPLTVVMWAPSAFLGVEVNKLSDTGGDYRRLSTGSEFEMRNVNTADLDEDREAQHSRGNGHDHGHGGKSSGIYFGIFNIYMTLPQFVGTMISSIVFAILEPKANPEPGQGDGQGHARRHGMGDGSMTGGQASGPNAIAVCLFIGALSSLVAAYATRRLKYIV